MASNPVHPCDERLPAAQLLTLGIQHVLVMYAGAVAVPLILDAALKLPKDQIAFLISADLFSCGVATLIQTLGLWIFGIRLPVIMGCTFATVGPMVAIGTNPGLGILDVFGATIAADVVGIFLAPMIGRLLRFFPPVVVGTVIAVIGLSLMGMGINWAAGSVGNPEYGNSVYLLLALVVLTLILMINKFAHGFIADISVLLGIVAGFGIAASLGRVDLNGVTSAPWVGIVLPFHFGLPHLDPLSIATMVIIMFVTFIESTGMFLAVRDMVKRPVDQDALVRGLRIDGLIRDADWRHLQLVSAYVVLAERRVDQRHGREEPVRLRNRQRDPRGSRAVSEDGAGSGLRSAVRARRSGHCHVRHGHGEHDQGAVEGRFRQESPQPVYRRGEYWTGTHASGRAEVLFAVTACT